MVATPQSLLLNTSQPCSSFKAGVPADHIRATPHRHPMGRASSLCSVGITLSWWGCQIMGWGYIHMCKSVIGLQITMLHTTAFDQEMIEGCGITANAILTARIFEYIRIFGVFITVGWGALASTKTSLLSSSTPGRRIVGACLSHRRSNKMECKGSEDGCRAPETRLVVRGASPAAQGPTRPLKNFLTCFDIMSNKRHYHTRATTYAQ
jgi:hypothetical protein